MCQQTYNRFLLTYLETRQLTHHSRCNNVISTVKRIKILRLICYIFSVFTHSFEYLLRFYFTFFRSFTGFVRHTVRIEQ